MLAARSLLRALLPFALHGLAREVDRATGVLLRTTLDLPGFAGEALALLEPPRVLRATLLWTAAGAAVWIALGTLRARREGIGFSRGLRDEAAGFEPLYLRPAITLLALVSLALRPTFPYGFTLPVALTQDWGPAQDAAALAALVALRVPPLRLPAPGASSIFFMAFLAYGLLAPPWARDWDGHPGNEPKYLRMAVALGHGLTLNVEGVNAPMEQLVPRGLLAAAGEVARALARESVRMAGALAGGPRALGASAIAATRITRQTVRGKEGGTFHVLAPGPSLLLAPALRVDRAVNRAQGTPGRLGATLLLWNALAAALAAAVFLLARDASGRPGLSALLAGGFALTPPFLFYFYQFYPEMLGALVLALVFRRLFLVPRWDGRGLLLLGLLLASLPWLHQKFLPVWAVLVAMAAVMAVDRLVTFRALLALLLPQAATLLLTALYNFAITGSVRPDALYLAWGPGGVTHERVGQGFFGLLLDARYGILPYAPVYALAAGGVLMPGRGASRLRLALLPALAYYLTVASADNWSGAVCSLGRYVMPVAPLLVAFVAVAVDRAGARRGALALVLTLAAWTALLAVPLWRDPHAANDCALLLGKAVFGDGNAYLPNLFIRAWSEGAPGLVPRIAVWLLLLAAVGLWLRRVAAGRGGESPARVMAGLTATLLAAALLLESWPMAHEAPRFKDGLEVRPGTVAFLSGPAEVEGGLARVRSGEVSILVRSRAPVEGLMATIEGEGLVQVPGRPPARVLAGGTPVELPLTLLRELTGRRGVRETLYRQRLTVETRGAVVLRFAPGPGFRPE